MVLPFPYFFHVDRHLFLRVFPEPFQNRQEQLHTPTRQKQDNKTPRENQDEREANKRKKTEKKHEKTEQ